MVQVVAEGEVPGETQPEPASAAADTPIIVQPGAQSPLALLRAKVTLSFATTPRACRGCQRFFPAS